MSKLDNTDLDNQVSDEREATPGLELLDDAAGPARSLSPTELAALAQRVERTWATRHAVRPRRVPRVIMLGGALALASAGAAGAVYSVVWSEPRHAPSPPAPPHAINEKMARATAAVPIVPDAVDAGAPAVVEVRPPVEASQNEPLSPSRGKERHIPAAADRLADANALRGQHRYREALALYLQVIRGYPDSIQASAARVAAAALELEQFGNIQGAEHLYRDAKTTGGKLIPEAEFGLAQVFRARADAAGERKALQEFVARYPESPLVSAAERRLETLERQ
jgi:tetratricopeptide (TPR) repeat protein